MDSISDEILTRIITDLCSAPDSQIDAELKAECNVFNGESHSAAEKYDFLVGIGKQPIPSEKGHGRISRFIQVLCDLEPRFKRPD